MTVSYNSETQQALRLEGSEWVPTQKAHDDAGNVTVWDGSAWVTQQTPEIQPGAVPAAPAPERADVMRQAIAHEGRPVVGERMREGEVGPSETGRILFGAERTGVSTAGAPFLARALLSFAPGASDEEAIDLLQQGLGAYFEEPVAVRVGPGTKKLEYFDPVEQQFTLVNPPGADLGDVASAAGPSLTLGMEAGLGIAGGSMFGPGGALAGAATGAFLGEVMRLGIGRGLGANSLTDGEIYKEAAIGAGIALGGGVAFAALSKIGRVGLDLVTRRPTGLKIEGISPREAKSLMEKIDEAQGVQHEIEKQTGMKVPITGGQATKDPFIVGREEFSRKDPRIARPFEEQDIELNDALNEFLAQTEPKKTDTDIFAFNRDVESRVGGRVRDIEGRLARGVTEAERGAAGAAREATEPFYPSQMGEVSGGALRSVLRSEQITFRNAEKAMYQELDSVAERVGLEGVPLKNWKAAAANQTDRRQLNLLMKGDEEEARILQKVLDVSDRPATFAETQATLSHLRSLRRSIQKGLTPDVKVSSVNNLIKALEADRFAAVRDRPILAAKIQEAELFVTQGKNRLDRSVVGKIMGVTQGSERVMDERVFDAIFVPKNGKNARIVADILKKSRVELSPEEIANHDNALRAMRGGIMDHYRKNVMPDGPIDLKKHQAWMTKYQSTAAPFFTKEERKSFAKPLAMSQLLQQAKGRRDKVMKLAGDVVGVDNFDVQRTFAGSITGKTMNNAYNTVWKSGDPDHLRRFITIAKKDPELMDGLRSAAFRDMRRSIQKPNANGKPVFRYDERGLGAYMDGENREEKLGMLFGPQYVRNLKTLREAIRIQLARPDDVIPPPQRAPALRHILRMYFRPLSARGKGFTGFLRIQANAADKAIAEAISSPEKLKQFIQLNAAPYDSVQAGRVLGAMGAYTLIHAPTQQFGE